MYSLLHAEECHKQWLALGFISELVSQVQNPKGFYLLFLTSVFSLKHSIPTDFRSNIFEEKQFPL